VGELLPRGLGSTGRGTSIVADGCRRFWACAFRSVQAVLSIVRFNFFLCTPCSRFPGLETISGGRSTTTSYVFIEDEI